MSISYDQKTWYNGEEGGTPITASELNRMEQGIADAVEAINEGGGGQGGGAHTNLDNIANTTTNSVRQLTINFMNDDDVKLNYCYGRDSYVCVREGKTYRSNDTVNWQEDNNNLSFGGDVQSVSVAYAFRDTARQGYVALIRIGARVFIYHSSDAVTWYRCNDLPNTETDYHDNGYSIDDSYGCSKFLEVDNKLFLYTGIYYSDNENLAQCIYTTNTSDWSVGTLTNGYDTVGAEADDMQTDGNYVYFSKINSDSEHGWLDLWRASDGLAFSKYAEISSNDMIYSLDSQIFYHNQRYYIQFHKGIATSNSLTTMVEQTVGFANDEVALLGFVDDTMLLQAFDYDESTATNTSCFVYLAPDSNGDYPITATKSEIENLDGCGLIGELDGDYIWKSNANVCFSNIQDDIDVKSAFLESTSPYNNFIKVYNATPFVNEVSLAANILGLGSGSSGGGSGTSDYPDLTNKPSINGVELLGNKLVGLLSTDIQINAEKIGYSGTVSGANTAKAAIESLQSSLSSKGNANISAVSGTTDTFTIGNGSTSSNFYDTSGVADYVETEVDYQLRHKATFAYVTLHAWGGFQSTDRVWLRNQYEDYEGELSGSDYKFTVAYCDTYSIYVGSDINSASKRGEIKVNQMGRKYEMPIFNSGYTNYATVTVKTYDQTLVGKAIVVELSNSSTKVARFVFDEELTYTFRTNYLQEHQVIYNPTYDAQTSFIATVEPQNYGDSETVYLTTMDAKAFPHVTTSTTDITAGTTALPTNDIYLVYE